MHVLYGALTMLYVLLRVPRSALVGILILPLAAEPCSTVGLLFLSQYLSGTVLLTLYLKVMDWRVLREGEILLYWPKLLDQFLSPAVFAFSSFIL